MPEPSRARGVGAAGLAAKLANYRPGGSLISLLLLAIVALTSFLSWQQYVRFANSTRYSNQAITTLNATVGSVREAESSQRGYLLTGNPQYLAEYSESVAATRSTLHVLDSLPAEFRLQPLLANFQKAVNDKLAELATTTDLAARGQSERALDIVRTNRGLRLMADIDARDGEFKKQLQSTLQANRENSRFFARLSQYVSTLGCAGIFVLVYRANRRNLRLISEAARINAELTRVNADLQQFVFSASHDLQEPLRTLTIHSQLAVKRAREMRSFDRELTVVERAARLMTEILQNLLLYTQAVSNEDTELAQADLNEVVKGICEVLGPNLEKLGAEVIYDRLPVLPISQTHARILMQNLLTNALKYRSREEPPRVKISIRRQTVNWILSVADNGLGIAPIYHQQIFGLFKRLHSREEYPGTGLGLAICKKIVERYGGNISVESQLGHGSNFIVVLPASK